MSAYRLLQILLVAFGAVFCLVWPLPWSGPGAGHGTRAPRPPRTIS